MSTPYGFGGGFLEGLAGSYANAQRMNLETTMAQRKNVWDTLQAALPNARPDAQVKIFQKLAGLASTPIHKKLDKSVTDFSDLMEPPATNQAQPPQPVNIGQDTSQSSVGFAPPPSGFTAVPLSGAGMDRMEGGRFPASGPSTGMARVPNDVQAPEVNTTVTPGGGGEGMNIGMTPGLTPPPYSPWYSPEEQAQIKAHETAMAGSETVRQEIIARRQQGESMGLKGSDLARYSLGTAPLVIRYQGLNIVNPDDPTHPMAADYEPMSGQYFHPGTQEPINNAIRWTGPEDQRDPNKVPMNDSPTGWGTLIRDKYDQHVIRIEPGAAPPAGYAPTYGSSTTAGVHIDSETGLETSTPETRGTVTQRGIPGQPAPKLTPPPATVGTPTTVGTVGVPKTVVEAQKEVNTANQRLGIMTQLEQRAKAQDQQAQIAILAAHMGMTAGIVPGVRIGATFWNEAEESAPWITRLLAGITKIDPATGERVVTSPLTGIKLASEQIDQMIDLARTGVQVAGKNLDTVRGQVKSGYGMIKPPPATKANTATRAQIEKYATTYHLTYEKAKQEFIDDGVTVDEGR